MSLFILTGEASGDLLASDLIKRIRQEYPEIDTHGVCGPNMRALGVKPIGTMETFQTLFPMSILMAPWLSMKTNQIKRAILKLNPKVCVFVDASFLSLTLAKRLRAAGFTGKLIKLVCPATWWPDHGRKKKLESLFDALISIFPHEREHFKDSRLQVNYFGHPLFQETLPQTRSQEILALFPGSRPIEIRFGIDKLLAACVLYQERHPEILIKISCAALKLEPLIEKSIAKFKQARIEITSNTPELLAQAKLALSKPGTINLELAQRQIPTLIGYPFPGWARWLVLKRLKLIRPHHAMINFVNGTEVFPELLLNQAFSTKKGADALETLDVPKIREACRRVIQKMRNPNPDQHAANVVLRCLGMLTSPRASLVQSDSQTTSAGSVTTVGST